MPSTLSGALRNNTTCCGETSPLIAIRMLMAGAATVARSSQRGGERSPTSMAMMINITLADDPSMIA